MTYIKLLRPVLLSVLLCFGGMVLYAQTEQIVDGQQAAQPAALQAANQTAQPATQQTEHKYTLYFRVNEYTLDPSYMGNAQTLEQILKDISASIEAEGDVSAQISLNATASPEGRYRHNVSLSERRKETVLDFLKQSIEISEVTFHANSLVEDWDMVIDYVIKDTNIPHKDEVLEVINSLAGKEDFETQLQQSLKKINNGSAYAYIVEHIFPYMRSSKVTAIYNTKVVAEARIEMVALHAPDSPAFLDPLPEVLQMPEPTRIAGFIPTMKLKVNAIGLGMGHGNIAAEFAVAEHFSIALPFYYSGGFDYFKPTIKFRGIVFQPEARYYIKGNEGFYLGAHLGVGWYNFAIDGTYRIQDHKGRRPAFGGGLGLGYTVPFKKHPRWGMEFAIGAGVYDVKYDMFFNEPNGPYAEHGVHDTFFGIDNASIAFTYKFDLKKEGGR